MTASGIGLTLLLAIAGAWMACSACRLLRDFDRPDLHRRRANASLRVGLGAVALSTVSLLLLELRPILVPFVPDRWIWATALSDPAAALCSTALQAMLFIGVTLLVRGIRATLFSQASGHYTGLRGAPTTARLMIVAVLQLLGVVRAQ